MNKKLLLSMLLITVNTQCYDEWLENLRLPSLGDYYKILACSGVAYHSANAIKKFGEDNKKTIEYLTKAAMSAAAIVSLSYLKNQPEDVLTSSAMAVSLIYASKDIEDTNFSKTVIEKTIRRSLCSLGTISGVMFLYRNFFAVTGLYEPDSLI